MALEGIRNHARDNANASVTASTDVLATKLSSLAVSPSQQYASDFNDAVSAYQDRIDNELFGSWVNTTAVVLNTTLVEFYDGVQQGVFSKST